MQRSKKDDGTHKPSGARRQDEQIDRQGTVTGSRDEHEVFLLCRAAATSVWAMLLCKRQYPRVQPVLPPPRLTGKLTSRRRYRATQKLQPMEGWGMGGRLS